MTTRKYSSRSQQTTLSAGINSSDTSATVVSGSALMGGITISAGQTYTVVIDPDTALEEIVDVTAVSTNTLTIVRGIDGSSGQAHSAGAVVRHMAIGRDYREANTHIETSSAVHGVTGSVVGTTDTQTLTNKTLTTPTIASFTNATHNHTNAAGGGTLTSAAISDFQEATEDVVGAMVSSNSESGISVTYDDATGKLNFDVSDPVISIDGDIAGSATMTNLGNVTINTGITAGVIVNADISGAAAIAASKIAGTAITAADTGTVTSTMIADGTIVNADINTSAQVAYGKLNLTNSIVNADINASAAIDKTKISGTAITAADTGTVTSAMIANGTIVDADINAAAAIAATKVAGTAITQADTGTVTSAMIADGTIVDADINASAAIAWTKIAPSATISATELGYLDGVTSAIQTQIDSKLSTSTAASTYAPLASPALTGTPTAPTAAAGTSTTQVATTAFVGTAVANLVAAAPSTLDTLNELAASLGNDANFSTTVTNNLATKLPLAGGTMSGAIAMGSNKITGLGTPTATGDAATKDYADTKLALSGGTMSGAIAMGTNKITGLGTPTVSTDAATKGYADTMLPKAGGTMSGAINMGSQLITNLADPVNMQDAVTKNYLNNAVLAPSNLTGPITSIGAATSIASQTGTGTKFVMDQSPTITTPTLSGNTTAGTINGTTIPSSKTLVATDSTAYVVPSQTGNAGKALTTDGTTSSWSNTINGTAIPANKTLVSTTDATYVVPSQTGNSGKFLTTDGTTSSWGAVPLATGVSGTLPLANGGTGATTQAGAANAVLPSQATNSGKYLTTDGTNVSWGTINQYTAPTLGSTSIASGTTVSNVNGLTINSTTIPSSKTLVATDSTVTAGTTSTAATGLGYMGLPQNSTTTGAYTIVAADAGKHIYSTATRTITIDSNANLALPIGTTLTFVSGSGATTTIAITTDTMYLAGAGTTGSRTLAAYGMATAVKIASTTWIISGNGLT